MAAVAAGVANRVALVSQNDLWEIDENLCRSELTEAEEAQCLARRKELWEARQSEQPVPVESKRADRKGHRGEGFAAETAKVTGETKQSINRKIARAEKIAPEVLEEVKGTDLTPVNDSDPSKINLPARARNLLPCWHPCP
ncbi:MAG: hypothetical protein J0H79_07435 [Alphaproteobacteria bacterium]|nr:hypothetical protein [Alphaproteobacteria bacterium]